MSNLAKSVLTEVELRNIVANGETDQIEFKIKPPRLGELAERICGMANGRKGGTIIFGIEDKTGRIEGISKPNEAIDEIIQAARQVKPRVEFVDLEPVVQSLDGNLLIIIRIPANNGTLYQAGSGFWIRKGSMTVPMTAEEIEQRLNTYGSIRWEKKICVRSSIKDIDSNQVERFLSHRLERGRRQMRYISPEDLLLGLECAGIDPLTQELKPTNAGILMFGYDPQLYIPESEVVCIHYSDNLGVGKYLDRKNFLGNLPELIDETTEYLYRHTQMRGEIKGFKRADIPEYPLEALREAVVNAIVHRDYSREGETVRIFIYTDRIEIHSPGLLLPGITIENLAQMRVNSRPRNPLLAQLLRDIPGYMERVGTGIRLMIQEMRQLGLPDPEFVEHHEVVVTFYNGNKAEDIGTGSLIDQAFEEENTLIPDANSKRLNSRQLIALQLVRERGSLSSGEYQAATGASESTALRDLTDLVKRGTFVTKGKKKGLRYFLP